MKNSTRHPDRNRIETTHLIKAMLGSCLAMGSFSSATVIANTDAFLEEIIVTATRRSESVQDIPISVTAVGGSQLASRGIVQTADIAMMVPNLKVNSQYGDTQPNFSLRGVGVANEFNSNTASPIGVYVDEVYQAFRFTHGLQLYDLDRIEVVRGPQGTLFGRNTTGGAVSMYTRKPTLEGTNGYVTAGYGNYSRKRVEGALEVTPVEDKVGLRVAFTRSKGDGYWDETVPSESFENNDDYGTSDNEGIRANLAIAASPKLSINLKAYYSKDNPVGSPIFAKGLMGGVPGTNFFGYSRESDGLTYSDYHLDSQGNYYTRTTGTALTINYDLSETWVFTSVSGYSEADFDLHLDNDGSPQSIFDARYTAETKDINQDLRLAYTSDKLDLLIGAYYGKDTSDAVNTIRAFNVFPDAPIAAAFNPGGSVDPSLPPTSLNAQHGYDQQRRSMALYTEGTYTVTNAIELTLGLRYTKDKLEFLNAFSNAHDDVPGNILFPFYPSFDQTAEDENVSGRIIFNYIWNDDIRTYASFSRGYRSGTYNGFAYSSPSQVYFLEPEELDSYEVGFKSRFNDGTVQLNGAIFLYDYTNQQVQEIVGAIGFLRSLDADVTGAELELLARPISSLTIRGSLGYLDTEYASGQSLSDIDVGGNWLPFASKWSASLGGDLTLLQLDTGEVILTAEANYVSKYFYDPFNEDAPGFMGVLNQPRAEDYLTGGDYTLVNARLSYETETYSLSVWGKNLSDKKYFPVGYDVTGAFGNTIYNAGLPRTYGIEASYKF
ncbi:MAG: TonB-dependent receptor [Porticoccaceae bacterium]|nr:TonB-dependent receptor [Porticoccaceae bacterium]